MFDLSSKSALVTGAGSGIGRAIAQTLAQAGALVWVADINAEGGNETVGLIEQEGGSAKFLSLDVTDAEACQQAMRTTGPLDILVNNAGVGAVGTILETSREDMDRMLNVNVLGVYNLSQATLPGMLERGSGSVINLASIGGIVGVRDRFAYTTTKFAVVGMTKAMALDHSHTGVRINCICPGRVETPFVQARLAEYPDRDAAYKEMASTQLNGRMVQPEEVAAAALYLASDEAAMVTGSSQMIDGGWSAGK